MGNNRQLVKDNLAKDLQRQIDDTSATLNQLRTAVSSLESNASQVKNEVDKAVDIVHLTLTARKAELTQEIDSMCQAQVTSLQEWIESACIRLGSLQSTLSSLDSLEGSQLVKLQVPRAPWASDIPSMTSCELQVDIEALTQEIENWGVINSEAKEMEAAESSSVISKKTVQAQEIQVPRKEKKLQPLFPENFLGIVNTKRDSIISKDPKDTQIEQWLSGMKIQSHNESSATSEDAFELVEDPIIKFLPGSDAPTLSLRVSERKISEGDESSIVCVEDMEVLDEMSKWLKPKKQKAPVLTDLTNQSQPPTSSSNNSCASTNTNNNNKPTLIKNHPLEFPCLQLDPDSWIHPKKRKMSNNYAFDIRPKEFFLNQVGQTEIIPPTYALPYPFWLRSKKH